MEHILRHDQKNPTSDKSILLSIIKHSIHDQTLLFVTLLQSKRQVTWRTLTCFFLLLSLLFTQTADYSYRAAVRELVPQLRYLDNVSVEEEDLSCSNTLGEDWETLRNSIKEHNSSQLASDLGVCLICFIYTPIRVGLLTSLCLMVHLLLSL